MPGFDESPYAGDWSVGAFGPPGLIWLGDIPLPAAQELVAGGDWNVVGQPLPPLQLPQLPPVNVPPPYVGGEPTLPPGGPPPVDMPGPIPSPWGIWGELWPYAGIGAAIWEGWPNALGSGELTPADRPPIKLPPGTIDRTIADTEAGIDRILRGDNQLEPIVIDLPGDRMKPFPPYVPPGPVLEPMGSGVIERADGMLPFPAYPFGAPVGKLPRVRRALKRAKTRIASSRLSSPLGIALLGKLKSRGQRNALASVPTPLGDPLSAGAQTTLETGLLRSQMPFVSLVGQPFTQTSAQGPTRGHNCKCPPARKGPRRKCAERAPIAWSAGSRKGRSAGQKCVRWI